MTELLRGMNVLVSMPGIVRARGRIEDLRSVRRVKARRRDDVVALGQLLAPDGSRRIALVSYRNALGKTVQIPVFESLTGDWITRSAENVYLDPCPQSHP